MARTQQRLLFLSILIVGLGVCLPIYQKIYQAYIKSSDEHIKPGLELPPEVIVEPEPELKTSTYGSYENQLELKAQQLPKELANNAEVIFVSGYEPDSNSNSGNRIKVKIDRRDRNVVLVLSNYKSIVWEVEATPNTNIIGIIQSSYDPSAVVTTSPTQGFLVDLPYPDDLESITFVNAMEKLNKWLGIEKVDTFVGRYSLPASIAISELDPPHPSLTLTGYPTQKPEQNFEFTLYNRNYKPSRWTLEGAVNPRDSQINTEAKIAASSEGTEIYELTDDGIKVTDTQTGKQEEFKPPRKFPEFSWVTDIAYDSKRNLVAVTSSHVQGYFYRFDPKKRRWLDVRSTGDFEIKSFAYDSSTDKYIAWADDYPDGGTLLTISGTGKLLSNESIADKMPGYLRLYDRSNGPQPLVKVAAKDNNVALIGYEDYIFEPNDRAPKAIWHYDLNSKIRLTYKSGNFN